MNVAVLLARLRANGVEILVEDHDLRLRAPRGLITGEMIQIVRNCQEEVREELLKATTLLNPPSRHRGTGLSTRVRLNPAISRESRRHLRSLIDSGGTLTQALEVFEDMAVEVLDFTRADEPEPDESHEVESAGEPEIRPPRRPIQIRTTSDTRWNDPARSIFTIPAGTICEMVDLDNHPMSERERAAFKRTMTRARRGRVVGAFVMLEGQIRFLESALWETCPS